MATDPMGSADQPAPVVTVSASYGSGGSVIAPALATRLGLPFVDRLLSADVSEEAARQASAPPGDFGGAHSRESLSDGEQVAPGSRLLTYLSRAAAVGPLSAPLLAVDDADETLRETAEADLADLLQANGGVVLGRAAAVALAGRPRAYHVRLDGPVARRVSRAAEIEGIPKQRAADRLAETDRARLLWVRRLYRADAADPAWYHLWLDTTVIGPGDAVDIIADAVGRFLAASRA